MGISEQVHWHEGLFLQPHHLQLMQRHVLDQIAQERRLAWSYSYGVVACELSEPALQNARIQMDRLHVVMRSGREVRFPGNADLAPLDITRALEMGGGTLTVSLAVPQWHERRANSMNGNGAEKGSDSLFRIYDTQVFDENTGTNPQPVPVRRINARLIVDDDGRSEMETLPLLRIKRAAGEAVGRPIRDYAFIPPTLVMDGAPELRRIVSNIADDVNASRREVVADLQRVGFSYESLGGPQYGQLLKLRALNRFGARLPAMNRVAGITPFQMYVELRDLLAELVALEPAKDELFEVADYTHEDPGLIFYDLSGRIHQLLKRTVTQRFLKVQFNGVSEDVLVAVLTDDHLTKPNAYFLGVSTSGDPTALQKLVLDRDNFKLKAKSTIRTPVRGIKLVYEPHPPSALVREEGLYYFRLDQGPDSERAWNEVRKDAEKSMAIKRPGGEFPDAKYWLYMTIA